MQAFPTPTLLNESIYFDFVPPPTFAGHINRFPFRVVITSSNDNPHYVYLNALYSKSYDAQIKPSKWSFLRPECKFLDLNENKIDTIKTIDTNLYIDNNGFLNTISGTFIGVSGYAEFYFIDDWFNFDLFYNELPYSTIVATLQISGIDFFDSSISDHVLSTNYSNSKTIAYQPHVFTYRPPDYIKISENGIRDFINPRWYYVKQPIVFTLNWKDQFKTQIYDGNEIKPVNFQYNFCKCHPYSQDDEPVHIESYNKTINSSFLNSTDITYKNNDGYLSSGYNKNYFYAPKITTLAIVLTAMATVNIPPLNGNTYNPKIWISNPNAGLMGIYEYNFIKNFPDLDLKSLPKVQIYNFDVPVVTNADYENKGSFNTIGYHGINSIAALPSPYYQAWACDGELNYLYLFGSNGQILKAIDINKVIDSNNLEYYVTNAVSPASIVLDGDKNIWMTLYDTLSVLKFDNNGEFQFAISPNLSNMIPSISSAWYESNEPYMLDGEYQNFIEPTYVDTDTQNNIWVTYSNYASGLLVKYDNMGNVLTTINYPLCSSPQDIVVDVNDNIWVALSNNTWDSKGTLEKRDTNGVLLSSFNSIRGINNLTIDINQNPWFTYSYSRVGYVDTQTCLISSFNVLDYSDLSQYAPYPSIIPEKNTDDTALEGIACDSRGYIYVINSVENRVYIFNSRNKDYVDKFYVNPQGYTFWNRTEDGPTELEQNQWNKSAQAYGDWTSMRWNNKYSKVKDYSIDINNGTKTITLSGSSIALDFYAVSSSGLVQDTAFLADTFYRYLATNLNQQILVQTQEESTVKYFNAKLDIYKINENFDLSEQMKSFSFMPVLQESEFLYDKFFPTIFGAYGFKHDDLGLSVYEKISNFVINSSDVDICNIDQLYSLAEAVNEETNDYRLTYPNKTKRLMDLLSINQSRLWGSPAYNQNNFKKASDDGILNRGELLDSNTYQVSAGTPIVLKAKSLEKYELIQTGIIDNLNYYPLSSLADFIGINNLTGGEWQNYYEFYEYIQYFNDMQVDGVIDWNNQQTSLKKTLSSNYEWVANEKAIDRLFSYDLYSGLGIFPPNLA
jgi:streptogramin lyase